AATSSTGRTGSGASPRRCRRSPTKPSSMVRSSPWTSAAPATSGRYSRHSLALALQPIWSTWSSICSIWTGYDLRQCRLEDPKAVLAQLLAEAPPLIRYSDHVIGSGPKFHQAACAQHLEGVVSKRRSAPYRGGRQRDWLKVKCVHREEFAVIGWTDPS